MPVQLPLEPSTPSYQFATTLNGTQFGINVRWNARAAAWYMDVLDDDEQPIRTGIKLVLGKLIGVRVARADFPDGAFMLSDLARSGEDADFDAMGDRVQLYFFPADELG